MTTCQSDSFANDGSANTLGQGIERAAAGVHEAIEVLSGLATPLVAQLVSNAHLAVDKASGLATSAVQVLGVENDVFKDVQLKLADSARLHVQQHPLASLSLALVAGFAVDRLLLQGVKLNGA